MNTKEKIANLLSVAQRLCTILERENTCLQQRKPELMQGSVEEKLKLSKAYELLVQTLASETIADDEVSEAVRENLVNTMQNLDDLVAQNARHLKVAIESSQRLMDAVANAVKTCTPHHKRYGSNGVISQPTSRAGYGTSPLSVNQTL